jgi:hypothetical protein
MYDPVLVDIVGRYMTHLFIEDHKKVLDALKNFEKIFKTWTKKEQREYIKSLLPPDYYTTRNTIRKKYR